MKITNPITLDVARSNSYICLLAKQFDSNSRYLEITLADNGQPLTIPADASAVLRATRADGTGAVVSGTVANGKATVEIDDYILEVNGAVTLSLEISKDGETLTTPSCNLTVQKADANGWIRVYVADANKVAGNYYITIGGVSYSFTTSQAIPAGGSVYFSSNNATAETRDATGTVIETGLVLTEGTTGTQLVTDVPTMSFLATIAGRVAALESEMPNKADKDGIIALAENLTPYSSTSGATQSVPFIAQEPGTGNGESVVNVGSYSQIKDKLGNSVTFNQLLPIPATPLSKTENGVTFTDNRDGTYTVQTVAEGASADTYITVYDQTTDRAGRTCIMFGAPSGASATTHFLSDAMGSVGRDTGMGVIGNVYSNGRVIIRITVKSGAIITTPVTYRPKLCDLSLWYGSTGRIPAHLLSHPEDFGRYYSGSLAANPGHLVNADGTILTSTGADGVTILAELDTGSEVLRGVEESRDEKSPNGTITRNRAVVDLGTLNYTYNASEKYFRSNGLSPRAGTAWGITAISPTVCDKYVGALWNDINATIKDMSISAYDNQVRISNSAYTDPDVFKAAMSGVYLEYPLATPTTEQGTPFSGASADNFAIDDFGSMYWTQSAGVPQGVEIFYPYNYAGFLDQVIKAAGGDANQIPAANPPTANGTYVFKATVSGGTVTYSWVAE